MVTRVIFISLFFASTLPKAKAEDSTGMKISASVDAVGQFKASRNSQATDRLDLREVELMVYGPVDYLFDGKLSLAAHREEGLSVFEIHEAYLSSSKWLARTQLKLGQYFLGIGRLNQMHRHEWPFISPPTIHRKLFGDEGVLDSGLEVKYLFPLPFYLDLTLGLSNGWTYGHAHSEGEKPRTPTHYLRVASFFSLPAQGGLQAALNYLHRKDSEGESFTLYGLDLVAKWRRGSVLRYLLQSEIWQRNLRVKESRAIEKTVGGYLLNQYGLSQNLSCGLRLDYYSLPSLTDALGRRVELSEMAIVPSLSYSPSEFSRFRLAYLYQREKSPESSHSEKQTVEFQSTFTLGAHPAHDF